MIRHIASSRLPRPLTKKKGVVGVKVGEGERQFGWRLFQTLYAPFLSLKSKTIPCPSSRLRLFPQPLGGVSSFFFFFFTFQFSIRAVDGNDVKNNDQTPIY